MEKLLYNRADKHKVWGPELTRKRFKSSPLDSWNMAFFFFFLHFFAVFSYVLQLLILIKNSPHSHSYNYKVIN